MNMDESKEKNVEKVNLNEEIGNEMYTKVETSKDDTIFSHRVE